MRRFEFLHTPEFRAGVLSGILMTLAGPPSVFGFLGYVALVPLLLVFFAPNDVRQARPVRLKTLVLSFGLAYHVTQLHWLILLTGASPLTFRWALPFMLVLLALYLTVGYAVLFWALARLRQALGVQAIWFFPGLWVIVEWARALGDMGFPWLRLATTQLRYVPMLQVSGLVGELGVSFVVAWINVFLVIAWQGFRGGYPTLGRAYLSRWWAPSALVLLVGTTLFYGVRTTEALERDDQGREHLSIGVVQANVNLLDKWDPAKRDSTFVPYDRLTRKVAAEGARLVIWPETAIPMDLPRRPEYLERVRDTVVSSKVALLAGFPERIVNDEGLLDGYNSSFLMDDQGILRDRYRKMHLLAFGERIPFQGFLPILSKVDFGQAEWNPGPEQTVFDVDGHKFSALICFESIFSDFARSAVQRGAGFLVNITNDGWFGDTILPHQHAWMAIMRAAENRVPLIRCANNGLSFAVTPAGRLVHATSMFERETFVRTVQPRPGGSFYTRNGDRTLFLLIALSFAFLVVVGRKAR